MIRKLFSTLCVFLIPGLLIGSGLTFARDKERSGTTRLPQLGSNRNSPGSELIDPAPSPHYGVLQGLGGNERTVGNVALGEPGLSFRYVQTFGETEVAYIADTNHINFPWGLGVDGSTIWIGEFMWGNRALKYTNTGTFQMQIGVAGNPDVYDTVLAGIADVAVDTAGNIWLVDDDASHLVKFDASGNKIGELGSPWGPGSGKDRFEHPQSIAFDAVGNFYVSDGGPWWSADVGNHRVQIFDSAGNYINTIGTTGSAGSGNNQFHGPRHIAIYGNLLYAADSGNHRVQIFDVTNPMSSTYVTTIGVSGISGTDNAHLNNPSGVAIDGQYIYIADSWNNRVQIFDRNTRNYVTTIGAGWGTGSNQFKNPSDVAVDTGGNLYVADFVNMRVQQFSESGKIWTYMRTYGVTGVPYVTDDSHFNHPSGVAVASDGSIYLTEDFGHRLIKLDSSGAQLWTVGAAGVKGDWDYSNDRLNNPADVALDLVGNAYVADRWHGRVQIYNPNGSYFATVENLGCPAGVTIGPTGYLYVADSCNHTVNIYDTNLALVSTIGIPGVSGSDNSHFNWPEDVVIDSNGFIFVSDQFNQRIQVFNANRAYVRTMGVTSESGTDFSHFSYPNSLFLDNANRLYVADQDNNRIQVFDENGAYLTTIGGSWGNRNGQLQAPLGVGVDESGNVYTADWGNHRIQKFAPGVPGWRQVNINGFGDPGQLVGSLDTFMGKLYAGTGMSFNGVNPAQVLQTADGHTWTDVSPSWTISHTNVADAQVFGPHLYFGTDGPSGGEIWRTDGTAWTQVVSGGFGNPDNTFINTLAVFSNTLYAATTNENTGIEIWRSTTGNVGSWGKVHGLGAGASGAARWVTMDVYSGFLYLGASRNYIAELWRTDDGVNWSNVFNDGLGNPNNTGVSAMATFNGNFYIGLVSSPAGEVWRSSDIVHWTPVITDGLGDLSNDRPYGLIVFDNRLYVVFSNLGTGAEVWASPDGDTWQQVADGGWGDSNNGFVDYFDKGAAIFEGNLYIGTRNGANGGEVWQLLKQIYLPLISR